MTSLYERYELEGESVGDMRVRSESGERVPLPSAPGFLAAASAGAVPAFRLLTAADIAALSPSFTNLSVSGWARVGSLVVPANTTAGDITGERIFIPNQNATSFTGLINAYSNSSAVIPIVARLDSGVGTGAQPGVRVQGAQALPVFEGLRSQGTIASPTAVTIGNTLLALNGRGFFDTTTTSLNAQLRLFATENWSSTNRGTGASLALTAIGSAGASADSHTWTPGGYDTTGYVDADVGFRVNGAAASGQYIRGNGTNGVFSAIQAADLPSHDHTVHANRTRTMWLPARLFYPRTGAPTLAVRGANSLYYAYDLDAASLEDIITEVEMPSDYVSGAITVKAHWTNLGAGAGNVDIRAIAINRADTGDYDSVAAAVVGTTITVAAPAQNIKKVTTLTIAFTPGAVTDTFYLAIQRVGGNAADTLANDIGIVGAEISYTADS